MRFFLACVKLSLTFLLKYLYVCVCVCVCIHSNQKIVFPYI